MFILLIETHGRDEIGWLMIYFYISCTLSYPILEVIYKCQFSGNMTTNIGELNHLDRDESITGFYKQSNSVELNWKLKTIDFIHCHNPNSAWTLNVAWVGGHILDHTKTLWKTKICFFDFLKVYNESWKVKKFWTSKPLFSWRITIWKKCGHIALWTNECHFAKI